MRPTSTLIFMIVAAPEAARTPGTNSLIRPKRDLVSSSPREQTPVAPDCSAICPKSRSNRSSTFSFPAITVTTFQSGEARCICRLAAGPAPAAMPRDNISAARGLRISSANGVNGDRAMMVPKFNCVVRALEFGHQSTHGFRERESAEVYFRDDSQASPAPRSSLCEYRNRRRSSRRARRFSPELPRP